LNSCRDIPENFIEPIPDLAFAGAGL
jgi:hypothetical protein